MRRSSPGISIFRSTIFSTETSFADDSGAGPARSSSIGTCCNGGSRPSDCKTGTSSGSTGMCEASCDDPACYAGLASSRNARRRATSVSAVSWNLPAMVRGGPPSCLPGKSGDAVCRIEECKAGIGPDHVIVVRSLVEADSHGDYAGDLPEQPPARGILHEGQRS